MASFNKMTAISKLEKMFTCSSIKSRLGAGNTGSKLHNYLPGDNVLKLDCEFAVPRESLQGAGILFVLAERNHFGHSTRIT